VARELSGRCGWVCVALSPPRGVFGAPARPELQPRSKRRFSACVRALAPGSCAGGPGPCPVPGPCWPLPRPRVSAPTPCDPCPPLQGAVFLRFSPQKRSVWDRGVGFQPAGSAFGIFQLGPFPSSFANPKSPKPGCSSLPCDAALMIQRLSWSRVSPSGRRLQRNRQFLPANAVCPESVPVPLPPPRPGHLQLPTQACLLWKPCFGRSRVTHGCKCWGKSWRSGSKSWVHISPLCSRARRRAGANGV